MRKLTSTRMCETSTVYDASYYFLFLIFFSFFSISILLSAYRITCAQVHLLRLCLRKNGDSSEEHLMCHSGIFFFSWLMSARRQYLSCKLVCWPAEGLFLVPFFPDSCRAEQPSLFLVSLRKLVAFIDHQSSWNSGGMHTFLSTHSFLPGWNLGYVWLVDRLIWMLCWEWVGEGNRGMEPKQIFLLYPCGTLALVPYVLMPFWD